MGSDQTFGRLPQTVASLNMPAQTEEMVPAVLIAVFVSNIVTAAMAECRAGPTVSGAMAEGGTSRIFQLANAKQRYMVAGLHIEKPIVMPTGEFVLHTVAEPDRYDRIPVIVSSGGTNLQEDWLKRGRAIIYGRSLTQTCLNTLRKAEDVARAANRGWWRKNTVFRSDRPGDISLRQGRFAVVSGRILSVGDRKRRLYLNFGQNWAEDFTVSVAKTGAGRFTGSMDELIAAQGRWVEIRGLVEMARGPLIRLFHASQIRFLDGPEVLR
ncbi:MAG: thermonuclease family protein [Pseudomonadota bacterium]